MNGVELDRRQFLKKTCVGIGLFAVTPADVIEIVAQATTDKDAALIEKIQAAAKILDETPVPLEERMIWPPGYDHPFELRVPAIWLEQAAQKIADKIDQMILDSILIEGD